MTSIINLYYLDENTIQDNNGKKYILIKKLEGRGQAGFAAFYELEDKSKQILIKIDDPATCVMEGSADFVTKSEIMPKQLINTVNYAQAGLWHKNENIETISVQEKVSTNDPNQIKPWDVIVYGKKRNPRTLFSEESWHNKEIKRHITNMSPTTQWQLVGAIFASCVAGDESLHLGQFMATQDQNGNIVGIKRIDLGARERFAIARNEDKYDIYSTSTQYANSGQFSKDYISFLLDSEDIKRKYILLWSFTKINSKIEEQYMLSFINAIIHLPKDQKQLAYEKILKTINKNAKTPYVKIMDPTLNIDENIDNLANTLSEIAKRRAKEMQKLALIELKNIFENNTILISQQQLIEAYQNNNFEKINNLIDQLEKNPLSAENAKLILHICDTAILMSMNDEYIDKQQFYLDKLKEYQIKQPILEFIKELQLANEIVDSAITENLIQKIIMKYDHIYIREQLNDQLLKNNLLWNELFMYGLEQRNTSIINAALKQNLNFTNFGTENKATNHAQKPRTEGALLLAAKTNNYGTLYKLLNKRNQQALSTYTTFAHLNKTIGGIDRKDENNANIFHYLFADWNNIPQNINKTSMLKELLVLLNTEHPNDIKSIFSQPNTQGKTPLHIIIENNNSLAFTNLFYAIKSFNASIIDFIDFKQEATFEKNFLDYAYQVNNEDIFNDLIKLIEEARTNNSIEADERNQLLCSKNSPLTDEEKEIVKSKLQHPITQLSILYNTMGISGKTSFKNGVKLWKNKFHQKSKNTNSNSSFGR